MSKKLLLLVNLRETLVNPNEIDSPLFRDNKKHDGIVHKLHINSDFVYFIKRFHDEEDLAIVFYTDFCDKKLAQSILKKADLLNSRGKDENASGDVECIEMTTHQIGNVVSNKYTNGYRNVVVLDTSQGCKQIYRSLQNLLRDIYQTIHFYSVYTRLYTNSWDSFASFTQNNQEDNLNPYFFADSVAEISNFVACLLSKPQKTEFFFYHNDSKTNRNRYYLFDYYPIGKDSTIHEPFSKDLFKQVKGHIPKSGIISFFCSSIAASIKSSGRDIHTCAFVIIPSHTVGDWNPILSEQVFKCLINQYKLNDTRFAIKRTKTIPKQSITNQRSINAQLSSLQFDIRKIFDAECIVLLDDVTTSGVSVDACRQIIEDSGFQGTVLSFAVGGTQTSLSCSSPVKYNVFSTRKSTGTTGYIFDLDGTLLDSSNAKDYRDKGAWGKAYSLIPKMHPNVYIIAAVKELIRKGKDVAIVTSSISRYCYNVLHFLGIETDRITIVCYHDSNEHKPNPEPYIIAYNKMAHQNETIMCIGDEGNDIKACANLSEVIGVKTIPVFLNINRSDQNQPSVSFTPSNDVLQFNNELDFLFLSHQFYPEMSNSNALYRFASLTSPHYFSIRDFLKWLEEIGLVAMENGARIPTEKGEQLGISKILKTNLKEKKQYYSSHYSIKAQKEIIRSINTDKFTLFLQNQKKQ